MVLPLGLHHESCLMVLRFDLLRRTPARRFQRPGCRSQKHCPKDLCLLEWVLPSGAAQCFLELTSAFDTCHHICGMNVHVALDISFHSFLSNCILGMSTPVHIVLLESDGICTHRLFGCAFS